MINHIEELSNKIIASTDEAGAGCGFGPVVAAAVIMPNGWTNKEINDSKKLSEKKREKLFNIVINECLSYSIQEVSASKIDEINILQSRFLAMNNCINNLNTIPDLVLIDGNQFYKNYPIQTECVVKGDATYYSIAAASILAKVYRDRLMVDLNDKYDKWNIKKHKGYLTKEHINNINIHGLSDMHRVTFCQKFCISL